MVRDSVLRRWGQYVLHTEGRGFEPLIAHHHPDRPWQSRSAQISRLFARLAYHFAGSTNRRGVRRSHSSDKRAHPVLQPRLLLINFELWRADFAERAS